MRKLILLPLFFSLSCSSIRPVGWTFQDKPPMERSSEEVGAIEYSPSEFEPVVEENSEDNELETIPFKLDYDKKLYKFWIKYYTKKKNKARFARHLTNGEKFRGIVHKTFREEGLPEGLFYVGLIESGFNTKIKSHASATGPWQFMKGTAGDYGLRVDRWLDERTNIHKSTRAAAHYFKDLYNIFGSWELALCAYNAGENRIIRAIRKGNTRDYKELVKKKLIPKETTYYIPKVAAAMELAKNRNKYGINVRENHNKKYQQAVAYKVSKPFSLSKVGKDLGVSLSALKDFNPDIKTGWVHITSRRKYRLILPRSVKDKLARTKIGGGKPPRNMAPQRIANGKSSYRVKKGDNLITIARRSGVSVRELKSLNRLKSNRIYVGQKLKVHKAINTSIAKTKKRASRKPASIAKSSAIYKVRKGDNLTLIAKRYKTTVTKLKRRNGLRNGMVRIGQRLKVPQVKTKLYVVRKGDNLTMIARRFGVPIKSIISFNAMKNGVIFPLQELHIPLPSNS